MKRGLAAVLIAGVCALMTGCGPAADVAGEWTLTRTTVGQRGGLITTSWITLSQNGSAVSTMLDGQTLTGTLSGTQLVLSGPVPEPGIIITFELELNDDRTPTQMTGSFTRTRDGVIVMGGRAVMIRDNGGGSVDFGPAI